MHFNTFSVCLLSLITESIFIVIFGYLFLAKGILFPPYFEDLQSSQMTWLKVDSTIELKI